MFQAPAEDRRVSRAGLRQAHYATAERGALMRKPIWKEYIHEPTIQDAIFIFACSVALLIYGLYNKFTGIQSEWKLSPYLFPVLLSVFGALLSISLFYDGYRAIHSGGQVERSSADRKNLKRLGVFLLICLIYYVLFVPLGFLVSTALMLAALFFLLGERRIWIIALLSIACSGAIYVIFGVLLNVRFP
jgi:putative tricarboxylic transport membrane protein